MLMPLKAHKDICALTLAMFVVIAKSAWAIPPDDSFFPMDEVQQRSAFEPGASHGFVAGEIGFGISAEEAQEDIAPDLEGDASGSIPSCCDECAEHGDCSCGIHSSGWQMSLEASALQSQMASRDVDAWPNDFGPAGRITLGYETDNGSGVRAQAWGYGVSGTSYIHYFDPFYWVVNRPLYPSYYYYGYDYDYAGYQPSWLRSATYGREIELSMASAFLDFYKTMTWSASEVTIGIGPAFGHLEFNLPPSGDGTKYAGGGVSASAQAMFPLVWRQKWGIGISGQSRISLLTGEWDIDRPWQSIDTTTEHSDSMSIMELGVGPEFRRAYGRSGTHYWFVRVLAEFQQWRSDRMGPMAGDTLALHGATANFGLSW